MEQSNLFQSITLHALSKVFADEKPLGGAYTKGSALYGETFAFQVAFSAERLFKNLQVEVESAAGLSFHVRAVGLVPSEMPCYFDHDADVLRTTAGLYPDPLYDLEHTAIHALPGQWRSLWIHVDLDDTVEPGDHEVKVTIKAADGEILAVNTFVLNVIPAKLPKQRLIHTEWFHTDCIATQYGVDVFSEAHWGLLAQFVGTAVKHGMNMILTPLFTPPLDTAIGGQRPTVQLVDVEVLGDGTYRFGFDRLTRWVEMCRNAGVEYFEFSHLFTQWGAKHAPKIVATVDGVEQQIFGWDTISTSVEYRSFMDQFLPALDGYIQANGLAQQSWFHISDEPSQDHLETYMAASEMVRKHLSAYPIMDALSSLDFYEQGLVQRPIPANDHIEPFLQSEVPDLWTYYCCSQDDQVSNRFFNMPSARNRVLGFQLYKFGLQGFLHWGYNFWYTQYSANQQIDPFRMTDADAAFPSGDAYLVYPGEAGPVESIRLEVLHQGLQDLRALELLESWIGKEKTVALIEEGLAAPITFADYPRGNGEWLLAARERINQAIAEHCCLKNG